MYHILVVLLLLFVVFELLFICIQHCGVIAGGDSIWDIVESWNFNMTHLLGPLVNYMYVMQRI